MRKFWPDRRLPLLLSVMLLSAALLTLTVTAQQPPVSRYAGTGDFGYQDGPRLEATFRFPAGLALDRNGNILVADTYNNCIRLIKDDSVTTLAGWVGGKDSFGFPLGGFIDGHVANARFNRPRGVAVDSQGNIFVADSGNHVIRKITGSTVYTFAGTGQPGYSDGSPRQALFNSPAGLAIDAANNLYVADTLNHVIRQITPQGVVSTLAGSPAADGGYLDGAAAVASFNEPVGIAIIGDAILVVDSGNQMIRKITQGQVTTLAGAAGETLPETTYREGDYLDGLSAAARFNFPKGIAAAANGAVFVADTWNHRIRTITAESEVITLAGTGVAGETNGTAYAAEFNGPTGILYHAGKLYIADLWNNSLRVVLVDPDHLIPRLDLDPDPEAVQVLLDGVRIPFPDASPYLEGDATFVPVRYTCQQWGAYVEWSEKEGSLLVHRPDFTHYFYRQTDPLVLKDGRSFLDLEYLARLLGLSIEQVPGYNAFVLKTESVE